MLWFALVAEIYLLDGYNVWIQLGVEVAVIAVVSVTTYHLLAFPMIRLGTRIAGWAETAYKSGARPLLRKEGPLGEKAKLPFGTLGQCASSFDQAAI